MSKSSLSGRNVFVIGLIVNLMACGQVSQTDKQDFQYGVNPEQPDAFEHLAGGEASVFSVNRDAFSHRPAKVASDFKLDGAFTSGDHLFRTPIDGVGPVLNNNTPTHELSSDSWRIIGV